jgi:hypothetical protein
MAENANEDTELGPPVPGDCRAESLSRVNEDLAGCLVGSQFCAFSLDFGYKLLCRHPRRNEIVKRTNLDQPPAQAMAPDDL